MKENTAKLLNKPQDAIEAADLLLTNEKIDIAAGRAYYAMFYTAEALLNEMDLDFNKHSGVHAAFGKHFAQTKVLDPKFHRWLIDSFDKRLIGDYGVEATLQLDVVAAMIHQAQEFLEAAKVYLGKEQPLRKA
ncbi:MAG TPA: HEPN domain-containing protein [Anaerolineales bacterium]|nr:HEPN domain-containing protein [Anaerolineales bacterium]